MHSLSRIKKITVFGLINFVIAGAARAKTTVLYRPFFGRMGRRCTIYKPVLLSHPEHIYLGDGVSIRNGARLETVCRAGHPRPKLVIGNNVNIEQNVHIVCGSSIQIGNNVSITGGVAIVDVTHPYADIADPVKIGDRIACHGHYVVIGDGSFIGYGAIILPNVRIGKGCVIGAHAVVNTDIPDYAVATGNPARVVKQFSLETNQWMKVL